MSAYTDKLDDLMQSRRPKCGGLGTCDDAEPGTASFEDEPGGNFREWACPDYTGTGFKLKREINKGD